MKSPRTTWLDNQTELASALDTTKQTISRCRRDYPDAAPKPRPDGKWPLEPWDRFFIEHNIKGRGAMVAEPPSPPAPPDDQPPAEGDDWTQYSLCRLKTREAYANCIRKERENDVAAGKLSDPTAQIQAFGMACAAINTGFENLIKRSSPKLVGLKDPVEIEEILREEVGILINNLRQWTAPEEEEENA